MSGALLQPMASAATRHAYMAKMKAGLRASRAAKQDEWGFQSMVWAAIPLGYRQILVDLETTPSDGDRAKLARQSWEAFAPELQHRLAARARNIRAVFRDADSLS